MPRRLGRWTVMRFTCFCCCFFKVAYWKVLGDPKETYRLALKVKWIENFTNHDLGFLWAGARRSQPSSRHVAVNWMLSQAANQPIHWWTKQPIAVIKQTAVKMRNCLLHVTCETECVKITKKNLRLYVWTPFTKPVLNPVWQKEIDFVGLRIFRNTTVNGCK
jgi:hypothetical protein